MTERLSATVMGNTSHHLYLLVRLVRRLLTYVFQLA